MAMAVDPKCRHILEYVIIDKLEVKTHDGGDDTQKGQRHVKRKQLQYWARVTRRRNCTMDGIVDAYALKNMCRAVVHDVQCSWIVDGKKEKHPY